MADIVVDFDTVLTYGKVAVGAFLGLSFVYYTSVVAYNLFFHPLRNFPGPWPAAATVFYYSYYTVRGKKHEYTTWLHERYGEVVRIAPDELSFIGDQAWKDIYMHKQGRGQLPKASRPNQLSSSYSIIHAPDDDMHARQRKMLSHAFSDRALREQEDIINTYIDLMMSNVRSDATSNTPIDIVAEFNWTTFDIIGDLTFAESFHNLELRRPHPWLKNLFDSIRIANFIGVLILIPGLRSVILTAMQMLKKGTFQFLPFASAQVERRIKQGSRRPDFMTRVLENNRDDGTGITRGEIDATSVILIIAGSETTATLLSGAVYFLLRNPDKLAKLRQEVDEEFKSADEIKILKVSQMPYLLAVLEESLRLYPPVPVALPRLTPKVGASICGHWIPGGTIVGIPQKSAYGSAVNFVDPDSFIPERWVANKDPKFEKDRITVMQPFSAGPRNCLGKNLAYAEMKLILARLVFEFDFELLDPQDDWAEQRVFTLWEKKPLMLKVGIRSH